MNEGSFEEKEQIIKETIISKGYDEDIFKDFVVSKRGQEVETIYSLSLEELEQYVLEFLESQPTEEENNIENTNKNEEKETEKITKYEENENEGENIINENKINEIKKEDEEEEQKEEPEKKEEKKEKEKKEALKERRKRFKMLKV